MEQKPFYTSKTFWVNIIGLAWMFLQTPLGLPQLDDGMILSILGVLNIVLRFITKTEITISGQQQ